MGRGFVFKTVLLLTGFLCVLLTVSSVSALPVTYLTEQVITEYEPNSTLISSSGTGQIDIALNSTVDVLQYIRVTLSKTEGTNLLSPFAYRGSAASPNPGDKTRVYVNTTDNEEDVSYTLTNESGASLVYMGMDYQNELGGTEICHGKTNIFLFNLTFNATHNMPNVNFVFQAALDTNGGIDSMDIFDAWSPNPTINSGLNITSTDGDAFNDAVSWSGSIIAGQDVNILVRASITPGVNFNETFMVLDTGGAYKVNSSQGYTFTGITFADRFGRGPVREGIEMMEAEVNWMVRGFIKNMASSQQYIVHEWGIYEVGNVTPVMTSDEVIFLGPGEMKRTGLYASEKNKSYYSSAFDWEIVWGGSVYTALTDNKIQLPILYEIDSSVDKTAVLESNTEQGGTRVRITDWVRHLGHSAIGVASVSLNSVIPAFPVEPGITARPWVVSNVRVYYLNDTTQIDITSGAQIETKNANGGDGYVRANITDIGAILGHPLGQNDRIVMEYRISSPIKEDNLNYCFFGEHTLVTSSGTPYDENVTQCLAIPGVAGAEPEPPPEPGVPEGPGAPPFADIIKEQADLNFTTSFITNVKAVYYVMDSGDKGIKNVKFMVYIPGGEIIYVPSVSLRIWREASGEWQTLPEGNFTVIDEGLTYLENQYFREYVIEKAVGGVYEEGWDLFDEDRIELVFRNRVPEGTNKIVVRAFGYNYYEDKVIFEDAHIPFRRKIVLDPLEVTEGVFEQEKAVVGRPVLWLKQIDVYNPNPLPVDDMIENSVFKDTISAYIMTDEERVPLQMKKGPNTTYVEWPIRLDAKERVTYFLEVATPPVIEIDREAFVLESNTTLAKVAINSTIRNFAEESYTNISFIYHAGKEEILFVQGGEFTRLDGDVDILIPSLSGGEIHNISIVYQEVPPVLTVFLDRIRYRRETPVEATVLYIPSNETGPGYIEIEATGPEDTPTTIFADILSAPSLAMENETRVVKVIDISGVQSGKYTVYAKFKENFVTILFDSKNFDIEYQPVSPQSVIFGEIVIIIGIVVCIVIFIRVYKRKTYRAEVRKLRERAKKLEKAALKERIKRLFRKSK